jgi:hypothetical protein
LCNSTFIDILRLSVVVLVFSTSCNTNIPTSPAHLLVETPSSAQPLPLSPTGQSNLADVRSTCKSHQSSHGQILFTRAYTETNGDQVYDLFWFSLDNSSLQLVFKTPPPKNIAAIGQTPQGLLLPGRIAGRLSPDGKKLAYYDFSAIVVADSDGSNPLIIDNAMSRVNNAIEWSPDSTQIAYVDFVSNTTHLATLVDKPQVSRIKPYIPITSINFYSWEQNLSTNQHLYSAGCIYRNQQCAIASASYMESVGRTTPILIGSNTLQPRRSPTSNIIAMLAFSPTLMDRFNLLFSNGPGQPSEVLSDVSVSAGSGYDWSPDGCDVIAVTPDQHSFIIVNIADSKTQMIHVAESLQLLYPQWVK